MKQFEDELKEALRREKPPEGFAERVMARVEAESVPARADVVPFRPRPKLPVWVAAAAAASLAVAGATGVYLARPDAAPEPEFTAIVGPTTDDVPDVLPAHPEAAVLPPHAPGDAPPDLPARAHRTQRRTAPSRAPRPPEPAVTAEALRARDQLLRALAITSSALETVHKQVSPRDEGRPSSRRRAATRETGR